MPNPALWKKMLYISSVLSKPFPFLRVDLYLLNNDEIKIGELTFYPNNGNKPFHPPIFDYKFGDFFCLPPKIPYSIN